MNHLLPSMRAAAAIIVLSCVTLAGCGSPAPTASVTGTVTLNDKPLTGKAHLSFVGADNTPRVTETDESGRFSLQNLPVGEVVVIVSEARSPAPAAGGRQTEGTKSAPRGKTAPRTEVPAVYSDAGKPALRYTLANGDNAVTIQLKSAPGK